MKLFITVLLIVCMLSISSINAQESSDAVYVGDFNIRPLLNALYHKESGCGKNLIGDNGKAIGPYQIWYVYWKDALEYRPSIGGTYKDCMKKGYSEKIIAAYLERYAPNTFTTEDLARIHNGGPTGHKRSSTLKYWKSVSHILTVGCSCK